MTLPEPASAATPEPAPGTAAHAAPPSPDAVRRRRRRRASAAVAVGGTLALAAAMASGGSGGSGGSDPEPVETSADYAQVCRDEGTQERLEDEACENASRVGHTHVGWFFIPLSGGRTVPAVGHPATSGMTTRPGGTTVRVPQAGGDFAKSGTVSKGGFGSKGGGAGS